MSTNDRTLRVLIVDDNQDAADTLGMLVEGLGHQAHVTYGGAQALDVAIAFQPDLMLIDLAMPDMDGCLLVGRFRQMPAFARTRTVAITGHTDLGHKTIALKAGFDAVLFKPIALTDVAVALAGVAALAVPARHAAHPPAKLGGEGRLSIGEARRRRSERASRALTRTECEAAICEGIARFQEEYLGWRSEQITAHFVKDLLIVRIAGALTLAERQLGKSSSPEKGRDLIKQVRRQLLALARPMLESVVHEVAGVKVSSMHHDISTVTGEEIVVFSSAEAPRFEP